MNPQGKTRRKRPKPVRGRRSLILSNVCASGKRRYPSEARAEQARRKISELGQNVTLRGVYFCYRCGGYHTTSKAQT